MKWLRLKSGLIMMGILAAVALYGFAELPVPVYAGSAEETAAAKPYKFTPDPQLTNVLLLGDSISIGYTLRVRRDLAKVANVYRPMKPDGTPRNCGSSVTWTRGSLDRWLTSQPHWDVIHFNVGLHDLKRIDPAKGAQSDDPAFPNAVALKAYKKNMEKIAARLKQTGACLIFATTTPSVDSARPLMMPEDVVLYNAAAVEVMKRTGCSIDDLYSKVLPRQDELQTPNNVHFQNQGNIFIGKAVTASIRKALSSIRNPE